MLLINQALEIDEIILLVFNSKAYISLHLLTFTYDVCGIPPFSPESKIDVDLFQ